ncbi:MAG: beta-ketoacyl-[acyl-carrier-protein] synthase family protein [Deltaproteobacteria bacterium]|nr:beta-ketoacyl-[acyl-carrier-protein] synthase family protein [Deltaproteobacteria bacterium]
MTYTSSVRVAVTGLGIITSIGHSIPTFWDGLLHGRCGIGSVSIFDTTGFPCSFAAQVRKKDLEEQFEDHEIKRVSRCDLLGLIAVREAISDSGLDFKRYNRENIGVVLGGGAGGMLFWEKYRRSLWLNRKKSRPSLLLPCSPCTLTDLIASRYGLFGFRSTISTACSSTGTSIGYGFDLIRSGRQKLVVTGGSEALSELTFAGFNSLKVMDPEHCRPFNKKRRGLSLGEGAAILILEDYEQAEDRGATIYAEVLGYALNSDAFHITSPDPEAKGMSRVMSRAINNAGVNPEQVDYINAHGTASMVNDKMETLAIKRVFGTRAAGKIAISSTKSMVGHCLGASGAIEAVATVLALCRQVAPPTIHLDTPDPDCDLDYVPNNARKRKIEVAMSNSFAFGGNNTSLIFGSTL